MTVVGSKVESPERSEPIFIVGPPRSGTTLLARILGRHPHLFFAGELHFFEDLHSRRRTLGSPSDPAAAPGLVARLAGSYGRYGELRDQERVDRLLSVPVTIGRLGNARDWAALYDSFMRVQMEPAGKARWGNHVPKDVFHLGDLRALFPRAQFLGCVRDPLDVLNSYKCAWRSARTPDGAARKRRLYDPVLTSLLWRASVRRVLREARRHPASVRLVRYEDVVRSPERTVQGLCSFLGETYRPTMLQVSGHNSSFQVAGGGIFEESVGRGLRELEPEEIFFAQRIGGRLLAEVGYDELEVRPRSWRIARALAVAPASLIGAVVANRGRDGAPLAQLWRRAAALWH